MGREGGLCGDWIDPPRSSGGGSHGRRGRGFGGRGQRGQRGQGGQGRRCRCGSGGVVLPLVQEEELKLLVLEELLLLGLEVLLLLEMLRLEVLLLVIKVLLLPLGAGVGGALQGLLGAGGEGVADGNAGPRLGRAPRGHGGHRGHGLGLVLHAATVGAVPAEPHQALRDALALGGDLPLAADAAGKGGAPGTLGGTLVRVRPRVVGAAVGVRVGVGVGGLAGRGGVGGALVGTRGTGLDAEAGAGIQEEVVGNGLLVVGQVELQGRHVGVVCGGGAHDDGLLRVAPGSELGSRVEAVGHVGGCDGAQRGRLQLAVHRYPAGVQQRVVGGGVGIRLGGGWDLEEVAGLQ